MSNIRVTYSGLIGLVIGLCTVVTGIIFILIVTRSLTAEQLGNWGLIGGLISYVIIIEPMISYWSTREIARDIESGKTAIFSSSMFSIIAIIAFLVIAYFVGDPTGADTNILYFAALMIPFSFLNRTLSAIALAWKPHVKSLGTLIFDIAKIPAAIIFVYFMELGVYGAILSLIVAYIPSIVILGIILRKKLQNSFDISYLKNWVKRGWLPTYNKLPNLVILDVLIFSLITGSVSGIAYWIAATAIGTIVRHSSPLTKSVYPKLLSGGKKEHLQTNLMRYFYFAFPFIAISITFAKPGLFILNPIYDVAVLVVVFISLRTFVRNVGASFTQALEGIEEVDVKQSTTKEYLKSKLFYLPTIRLIRRAVYLISLVIGLYILIQQNVSEINLVIYWSLVVFIVEIPFTMYYYFLVRKDFTLSLSKTTILKYLIVNIIVFTGIYFLMEEFLVYDESIFVFLPHVFPFILLSVLSYFGLTYLVDKKTRILFKSILSEIKKLKK